MNHFFPTDNFVNNQIPVSFRALEHFPDFCFIITEDRQILAVNHTFSMCIGKTKELLCNQIFDSLLHPAFILKFEHMVNLCVERGTEQIVECQIATGGNTYLETRAFISVNSTPTKKNTRYSLLVILKDISQEKQQELDLLRFRFVAETTANPLQMTDLSGKMIFVNAAFEKASGYTGKELLGKSPNVFGKQKHSRKFWDNMWQTISSGKVWIGEVENTKKNGEAFHTQLLVSPIINSEKAIVGYFGLHRDLSDRRTLERQLIHTQKMESIGTLAAGVAHEVGNPLASISALVQIIQRQTKDEFIREKLELVKKQINRISKIIRDLVDFSRPSNYELKLTDINENVRESVEIVRVGTKAKDIEFIMDLDPHLAPTHLVADQIQQVFVNILINAVDALTEKRARTQIDERAFIKATSSYSDDTFLITFEDNGPGIKPENQVKIFEPFFTTKTEGKGTGLGLWVSYGIVKSFQGELKIESKYGQWTKFSVVLPTNPY